MTSRITIQRTVRLNKNRWRLSQAIATLRGESINGVLDDALEDYIAENEDVVEQAKRMVPPQ